MTDIVSNDDLFYLAQEVLVSMLDTKIERGIDANDKIDEKTFTACVQITGDWEGAVTIACPLNLANRFAATMFAMDPEDLSDDDVRDALGEIANMTGGGVKALIPGENVLALPTVAEGEQGALSITKARCLNSVVAVYDGQSVVIQIYGKES